jgi:hypothetical protein
MRLQIWRFLMKNVLAICTLLLGMGIYAMAQSDYPPPGRDQGYSGSQAQGRLSARDQQEFDQDYAAWQKANAKSDRDDIDKHARRMEDIMSRYNIPPDTPFEQIATTGVSPNGARSEVREYQGRFSPDDQKKFDKAYEHWVSSRRKHDRDDIAKDEGKMQELMTKYNIPRDVPYDALASGARGY